LDTLAMLFTPENQPFTPRNSRKAAPADILVCKTHTISPACN
jgi:hypothetical protein